MLWKIDVAVEKMATLFRLACSLVSSQLFCEVYYGESGNKKVSHEDHWNQHRPIGATSS